jgi:hypothetical protein
MVYNHNLGIGGPIAEWVEFRLAKEARMTPEEKQQSILQQMDAAIEQYGLGRRNQLAAA